MGKKKKIHIIQVAMNISHLIKNVDTDERGDLFMLVADNLKSNAQGYTGSLFEKIALEYGISKNDPKDSPGPDTEK